MDKMAVEPLVAGRVIGDVLDMFVPAAEIMDVRYGGERICNGSEVKPSLAANRPSVHIGASANTSYYTLVMVDPEPDAPTPTEPSLKEWLHWASTLDPLVVGRVVGDVLDIFVPTAELAVRYTAQRISINGGKVKPSSAAERPKVRITGSPDPNPNPNPNNYYYTLVMVDPDAPSPSEPSFREWLHWLVIDIPEGSDASEGKELMPYMGPQPPIGIHRHVFVAFRQPGLMEGVIGKPAERGLFSTRQFASDNQLGLPVAALYFNSQKQPAGNKRR